jgi:hypothetical protein
MTESEIGKQVRSFVSCALAMKPSVTLHRHCANEALSDTAVQLKFSDTATLSQSEVASLELMMRKYEPIKPFLHITDSAEDAKVFNIATCQPMVEFQPNVDYQIVKFTSAQFQVAKEVARRVDHTYKLHVAKDVAGAKAAYDQLHDYLQRQRAELIGDLKHVHNITDAVGLRGVGRNVNPDLECGGMVIFIIIEIFIG